MNQDNLSNCLKEIQTRDIKVQHLEEQVREMAEKRETLRIKKDDGTIQPPQPHLGGRRALWYRLSYRHPPWVGPSGCLPPSLLGRVCRRLKRCSLSSYKYYIC